MKKVFSVLLFAFSSLVLLSQEKISGICRNFVLMKKTQDLSAKMHGGIHAQSATTYDTLPFFDGFSKLDAYPDTASWLDSAAYINPDFPIAPTGIGVATLDGVNQKGYPYNFTVNGNFPYRADSLTSKLIRLDSLGTSALTPADSIYLSFFWQSQGRGDIPDPGDSILLEFRTPAKNWTRIWYKGQGSQVLDPFCNMDPDSSFHRVMIPITDTAWFKKGFQLRFRNEASICGMFDQWNIDMVYLNRFRTMNDTDFKDVAFVYKSSPLTKRYSAMPWEQYKTTDMADNFHNFIRNNENLTKIINYGYKIKDNTNTVVASYSSSNNIPANAFYYTVSSIITPPITGAPVNYTVPVMTDTTSYDVLHYFTTTNDIDSLNDTLHYHQEFCNYYAYDDGTAESAYGLVTTFPGAKLAYQFNLNYADTLTAVNMHWAAMCSDVSLRQFYITIWNNNGGVPGSVIFQDTTNVGSPAYDSTGMNTFRTYVLSKKVVLPAGTFYVGWVQLSVDPLNIGLDRNNKSNQYLYYNTSSTWNQSLICGAIMMRPIFRSGPCFLGTKEITDQLPVQVFPNPANDHVEVACTGNCKREITVDLLDAVGNLLLNQRFTGKTRLDVSALPNGVYFARFTDPEKNSATKKIVIAR